MFYYNKYSITEIENMVPFERDIFVNLTIQAKEQERDNGQP